MKNLLKILGFSTSLAFLSLLACSRGPLDLAAIEKNLVTNQNQLPGPNSNQDPNSSNQEKQIATGPIEMNLLNLPALLTPIREINVQVSGKNFSAYTYVVVTGDTCKDATYSEAKLPDEPIVESLQSGNYTLCVKGSSTNSPETSFKSYSWTIDNNVPGTILSGIPTDVNISPYLTATVTGTNAETYKYKVVPGYRTGEQCGMDEYSVEYKTDRPIEHKMTSDGEHTICVLGISRTGVVQTSPSSFNFFQNASDPSVSVTLSGGDPLPSVSNGTELNLTLSGLNLASEFSYILVDSTTCPLSDATQFASRTPFGSSNQKDVTLSSTALTANIVVASTTANPNPTKRGTKTLCVLTTKTVKTGIVRSSVKGFQFIVDLNSIVITESNISGLPRNPNINRSYTVRITPPLATTNFVPSTSNMYYKVEKVESKSVGECSFTGVNAIPFKDTLDIAEINQEGWWRFCIHLENSAKTKSNSIGVIWYKSSITASAPTTPANNTATIKLAQTAKATSLSQTISVASANPGMNATYFFKHKYFVGSKACADDMGTYSSPVASTLKLNINPLAKATGIHTICLLGIEKNEQGEIVAEQKEPMRYEWFHDETAPTVTVSNAPAISSNRLADVTIKFTAGSEDGTAYDPAKDARTLFLSAVMKDATGACPAVNTTNYPTAASTAFPTTGPSLGILNKKITLGLANTDDGKKISICYFVRDNSGNQSIPTSINWILDLTAPVAIATLDPMIAQNSSSKITSVKLAVSTENGAASYKAVLAAQSGCANVTYPTAFRTIDPANLQTFSISGSDGPRTLCIRAKDAAGNEQSINEPTIISWIRDTIAPAFSLTGAPTGTVTAASLNVSVTVSPITGGEAVSAWDYILVTTTTCPTTGYGAKTSSTKTDANGQQVANPITLTSTVAAGTSKTYGLCVRAYDSAGNASTAKISSWTQKSP